MTVCVVGWGGMGGCNIYFDNYCVYGCGGRLAKSCETAK